MKKLNIILIKPRLGLSIAPGFNAPARMEPIALAIIATLTPDDIDVVVIDDRFEKIPFEQHADLIGLSVCSFSAKRAYEIAKTYRSKGIPVVMGGFHPTLCPEEVQEHAEIIALGDAEYTWPQIIADLRNNSLKRIYKPEKCSPAVGVVPNRSIFNKKRYLPLSLIQFSRGCPRKCEFCSIQSFYKGAVSYRDINEVVSEVKSLPRRKVFFVDDNFLSNHIKIRPLLEAITPLGIRWTSQADMSFADDQELLSLVAKSGCQSLIIGFESLNEACIEQMGKECNTVTLYKERLRKIRHAGIMVYGTFLFGYDGDQPDVFNKTLQFACEEKLFLANFNPLQAFPGTRLYERLLKEGRLVYEKWWLDPQYRWHEALIQPRNMTPNELTIGCAYAREKFHSFGNIFRRLVEKRANARNVNNIGTFLLANLVSRLDIKRKTGLKLGMKNISKETFNKT